MTAFIFLAVACTVGAVMFVVVPLLRPGLDHTPVQPRVALAAALVVVAAAGLLYASWSGGTWRSPATAGGENGGESIVSLLDATRDHPDDVQAWLNLGRAYLGTQQWPLARRSFQHADRLSSGTSAAALSGLGQTYIFENNGAETEVSTALFNRALQLNPHSPQALFYTGLALLHAGDLNNARARFAAMRELGPPPQIMSALDHQISMIDSELARLKPDPATAIQLRVTLSPSLAARVPAGAALFVFVRAPQGGPPLAVKRLAATFPQQVELSAADSMIQGSAIAPGQHVQVMARVSARGTPVAGSGDLFGELDTVAGAAGVHKLTVDQLHP